MNFKQILDCDLIREATFKDKMTSGWVAWHVRFGSKADIALGPLNVCFTPKSGH
jgi:hypothetical protein